MRAEIKCFAAENHHQDTQLDKLGIRNGARELALAW
jgi:hypothetical protein